MRAWSTSDMSRAGQTNWLARLYEKTVSGIRANGLPRESSGELNIKVPRLDEQARAMTHRDILPPDHNPPSGVLDWLE